MFAFHWTVLNFSLCLQRSEKRFPWMSPSEILSRCHGTQHEAQDMDWDRPLSCLLQGDLQVRSSRLLLKVRQQKHQTAGDATSSPKQSSCRQWAPSLSMCRMLPSSFLPLHYLLQRQRPSNSMRIPPGCGILTVGQMQEVCRQVYRTWFCHPLHRYNPYQTTSLQASPL